MTAAFSLIPELEDIVQNASHERRAEALRRITALFLEGASRFHDDHIRLFGGVFGMLVEEIEGKARAELSRRLAPVPNSPAEVIRRLAKDDDIMVAGPVLAQSPRLTTADVLEIVRAKSQAHLFAVSSRAQIEEPVVDVLVERGDRTVWRQVAGNAGAQISESGFSSLLKKAEDDTVLAETMALRNDIPDHVFRELLVKASEIVQRRLVSRARPETQAEIRRVLAKVAGEVGGARPPRDFATARERVRVLADAGRLSEAELANFAQTQAYDDTVAALSELTAVPVAVVDRLMSGERPDPILILCKAAGYSWPTARDIILARLGSRGKTGPTLDAAFANFDRLSSSTAKRVVRFWQISPASLPAA